MPWLERRGNRAQTSSKPANVYIRGQLICFFSKPMTLTKEHCCYYLSHLSSVVSSSLPSPTHFSSLDVNAATDTLCSTLTSCLDDICPLSSRPARTVPSNPWLSDVLCEHRTTLHQQSENGANQTSRRTWVCINRCFHLSPLKSTCQIVTFP